MSFKKITLIISIVLVFLLLLATLFIFISKKEEPRRVITEQKEVETKNLTREDKINLLNKLKSPEPATKEDIERNNELFEIIQPEVKNENPFFNSTSTQFSKQELEKMELLQRLSN